MDSYKVRATWLSLSKSNLKLIEKSYEYDLLETLKNCMAGNAK